MAKSFKISQLLNLVSKGKYEVTDAGFAAIDRYDRISLPKRKISRKIAVQMMDVLEREEVKYYYKEELEHKTMADQEEDALAKLKAMPEEDKEAEELKAAAADDDDE